MNKQTHELLKSHNLSIDELNNNKYSFKEIYDLSISLNIPLKSLFKLVLNDTCCPSSASFIKAIYDKDINLVVKSIINGCIINISDTLYFTNAKYKVFNRDKLSDDISHILIELLLINGKWELARSISSTKLFYQFSNISDEKFIDNSLLKYLLGNFNFKAKKCIEIASYTPFIFNNLDEKSKKYVKILLLENYNVLYENYLFGKENGSYFECKNDNFAFYYNNLYYQYNIDNLYSFFPQDEQKAVLKIIDLMK